MTEEIILTKASKEQRPIGLLDSGLGGLSVFREVKKQLPLENIIYFGDTAHAPYGEKKDEQIVKYVLSIIDFLIKENAKLIIIACNTATAVALEKVKDKYTIPIIGVIQPGAVEATTRTKNNRIGIIGTEVTIRNKSYEKIIKEINPSITTFSNSCSNQVIREMEENSLRNKGRIQSLIGECVKPIVDNSIDTLILGCTHYPFLRSYIEKEINQQIILVDPAEATVKQAHDWLIAYRLINNQNHKIDKFFISGNPVLFTEIAEILLGYHPGDFQKIIL